MAQQDYEWLRPYAYTDRQHEFLDALAKNPSIREAAKAANVTHSNLLKGLKRIRAVAAQRGKAPGHINHPIPEGYRLKGVSTLVDEAGQTKQQWIKTDRDAERQIELLREAVEALCGEVTPAEPVKRKGEVNADLCNLYVITDYHIGVLCWGEETGEDWDTKKAESLLIRWFEEAIRQSPDAETAILGQLGDFLHWDGLEAVTPTSKHVLDADTRYQKVVRVAIRVVRRIVELLLEKHQKVHLVMAEGNHDIASSAWLREIFHAFYEDEPRATVDRSPNPYYAYQHGKVGLFFHHGHKRKPANVDQVLARQFREIYGSSTKCYAHLGHLHHQNVLETTLMRVEQHPTLAAADSHASRGGWISDRCASVITYHKDHGEVGRVTLSPEMVNG